VIDFKGCDFGCFGVAKPKWLPGKEKAGASSRTPGLSIADYKGKSIGKRFPVSILGSSMCDRSFHASWELGARDGSQFHRSINDIASSKEPRDVSRASNRRWERRINGGRM
jgi:hypothetical protein